MSEVFSVGQRVRIISECSFSEGVEGTIAFPPNVSFLTKEFRGDFLRKMITPKGEITFVSVVFDTPQFDVDGDGRYHEAEINVKYLELIYK